MAKHAASMPTRAYKKHFRSFKESNKLNVPKEEEIMPYILKVTGINYHSISFQSELSIFHGLSDTQANFLFSIWPLGLK